MISLLLLDNLSLVDSWHHLFALSLPIRMEKLPPPPPNKNCEIMKELMFAWWLMMTAGPPVVLEQLLAAPCINFNTGAIFSIGKDTYKCSGISYQLMLVLSKLQPSPAIYRWQLKSTAYMALLYNLSRMITQILLTMFWMTLILMMAGSFMMDFQLLQRHPMNCW